MPLLQLVELSFDYQDLPLLAHISFQLDEGDLLHIHGANGSGKTTLLKLLGGLYRPSSGVIQYKGTVIDDELVNYQGNLCFVGHKTGISPYLTVKENCIFDTHFNKDTDVLELVTIFKLEKYLNTPCGLLSAGQRRQVALLRLWLTHAAIWLLDEPFVALDDKALAILMNKIKTHREKGGAVILTSHQHLFLEKAAYKDYYL